MTRTRLTIGVAVAGLALAGSALAAPTATTVTLTAGKPAELKFTHTKRAGPAGTVTFSSSNSSFPLSTAFSLCESTVQVSPFFSPALRKQTGGVMVLPALLMR